MIWHTSIPCRTTQIRVGDEWKIFHVLEFDEARSTTAGISGDGLEWSCELHVRAHGTVEIETHVYLQLTRIHQ